MTVINQSEIVNFARPENGSGLSSGLVAVEVNPLWKGSLQNGQTPIRFWPVDAEKVVLSAGAYIVERATGEMTKTDVAVFNNSNYAGVAFPVSSVTSKEWQPPVLGADGRVLSAPSLAFDAEAQTFRTDKAVFGAADIRYKTKYGAAVVQHPGSGFYFEDLTVVVFHKGQVAKATIRAPTFSFDGEGGRDVFNAIYTVTSTYLAEAGKNPANIYEVPEGWPENLTIGGVEVPDEENAAEVERVHEAGWLVERIYGEEQAFASVRFVSIERERYVVRYGQPYNANPGNHRPRYKMNKLAPDANVDWATITQSLQSQYRGLIV